MVIRCEECNKKIFPEGHPLWDSWRCLYFYLELQFAEDDITKETFELLSEHLLHFKRFTLDDKENIEKG